MDSVYDMLNDVKVDLSEYEACELTDIEKHNFKVRIRKKLQRGHFNIKSKIAASAIVVLSIALMSTFWGNGVFADINQIRTGIEELFDYKAQSLDDYKTLVKNRVTQNGVTIKLNEVIIDDDQILVSSTFTSDEVKWDQSTYVDFDIYINGREITGDGGGRYSKAIMSDATKCNVITGVMPNENKLKDMKGNLSIKIVYNKINSAEADVTGNWVFRFKANKDKLLKNITTIPVNETFTIENGPKITIQELSISPIATKLKYVQTDALKYHVDFIVNDQNGKEIKWFSGYNFSGFGTEMYEVLGKDVTSLRIIPVLKAIRQPEGGKGEETVNSSKVLEDHAFEITVK